MGPDNDAAADQVNPFSIKKEDLSKPKEREPTGWHRHGKTNSIISSGDSMRYCDHMSRCLGLSSTEFDDLYRFFHMTSIAHCYGGDNAGVIGNLTDRSVSTELKGNALMAFTQW